MQQSRRSKFVFPSLLIAWVLMATGMVTTAVPAGAADPPPPPNSLTVGQRVQPADVGDLQAPLLGWQVGASAQSAYQVQVASGPGALESADVWDSGKTASTVSTNVAYGGPQLAAAETYHWRVRVWDGNDTASNWSDPQRFSTAAGNSWAGADPIWMGDPAGASWGDYTLEGTFQILSQNATVTFRAKDASNYFMWQFRGNGVNTLAPHVRSGNTFTQLKSVPVGKTLLNNTDYRFKIVASGATITTYLDDVLIDTTTNATHASGTVGFRTGGTERNTWDNLKVTAANGAVLYQNEFATASADFPCGTVAEGKLSVDVNQNCVYGLLGNNWAFMRGEVQLQDKDIASAVVSATAASTTPGRQFVYKLWLNGTFVGLGPTQPIASEHRYDGFDVTQLLRKGEKNALGALAWTTSDKRFLANLVVEYTDGTRQTFGTGSSWKAMSGASVYPEAGSIGTSYFTAPKENIQSAAYPTGFDKPGFDDSTWAAAAVKTAFPTLSPNPAAKVEHQLKRPELVVEKAPGQYFIDYGRTWIGGLSLDVVGTAGQVLDVRFGEVLSAPQTVKYAMNTGNNYQDKWTLRNGPQHLETWGMRVFRYAEVLGAPTGLTAEDFPALAQVYPYDPKGATFESSDGNLNKVWELSKHTVDATNHNLYVDSWTRERDAYEADSYLQMMANFFISADPTLGNYSLEYLLTGRTWPTEWPMYTILAFHDSYQQTGDTQGLARNYDKLKAKLPDKWFEASTGLIRKDTGSNGGSSCNDCDIVDWPQGERDGYVFRPYNTVVNAISYRSYRDMAAIATALGKPTDAASFTAKADRLRDAMNQRLWDPAKGAYRDGLNADGTPISHYAIQASVFATAFGVPDEGKAAQAAEYIRTRGMVCSVYCAAFVLESLYNGDRADVAHTMLTNTGLRSWMNMINKGAGATMEAWDATLKSNLTYSHPWAASPAYNVPQGMFGIKPTTPGYATFDVRPQPDAVQWAHVTLPTLKGRIGAAYDTVDGRTDVGVFVPGNTVARVSVPGAPEGNTTVYVDGKETAATYDRGYLRVDNVPAGCHVLSLEPGVAVADNTRLTSVCPQGSAPDLVAPILAVDITPAQPTGQNGWYTAGVTVSVAATDAGSGVGTVEYLNEEGNWTPYTGTIQVPDGTHTYNFRTTDKTGNVSATTSTTVQSDATGPTLTWNGQIEEKNTYVFGSVPASPTCTAQDATSGPDRCDVSGHATSVGTHSMTATASDIAGNSSKETRSYTVAPWRISGFQSPVDMGGALNAVKAGSTVPLKFEVFAGETELTSTSSITGIKATPVSCDASLPLGEMEATATGNTTLRYDSAGGKFAYNWKTPKTKGCYQVKVSTLDGSSLTASFQLR